MPTLLTSPQPQYSMSPILTILFHVSNYVPISSTVACVSLLKQDTRLSTSGCPFCWACKAKGVLPSKTGGTYTNEQSLHLFTPSLVQPIEGPHDMRAGMGSFLPVALRTSQSNSS